MLNNLLDNESGTGIVEFNATVDEANRKYSQSIYAKTELGQVFTQLEDLAAVGGEPVKKYIETELGTIMKEAKKEMLTQVVLPELVALRDAFNRFFSTEIGQGYYIDFDLTVFPELQEDMKELLKIAILVENMK